MKTITVHIKVEGMYPPGEIPVCLHENAGLGELMSELYVKYPQQAEYLFNMRTKEMQVRAVIVNTEFFLLNDNLDRKLVHGDKIYFILLIGGG